MNRCDPAHVIPRVMLCMHQSFSSVAPSLTLAKVQILACFFMIKGGTVIYM